MSGGPRQLVLAGAGHAHLHVAARADRLARAGLAVTLVDPGLFWYSGLATGMLGGAYDRHEDQIDPTALIEARGGRFLRDRLVGLDPAARLATLESGRSLAYDALSLNLGSRIATGAIEGVEHAWTVKPIRELWRLRETLERSLRGRAVDATVVGGGATGCEIAANLAVLGERRGGRIRVRLVASDARLLPGAPAGAARALTSALEEREVAIVPSTRVRRLEPGAVVTGDGRRLGTDLTVLATGLEPPPVCAALGLPLAADGGVLVDAALCSVGAPDVMGAGDCIHLQGHELPRLGVFGVREAPILAHNLLARATGRPLRTYTPQRRWLAILNLGRGEALALRGRLWWRGRLAMALKHRLDRRFLDRYR